MNIREKIEARERDHLSEYASLASESKGRQVFEEECPMRTVYQRDRDRILHSKAFRRLKHKTQVYISPNGDHYRTRLTHTLEVSQIARSLARGLDLNEDLVEAISLGHDLGHTPFGHIGEEALDKVSGIGFKHNKQSRRVVDELETSEKRRGLNLTYEVRDGILNHSGPNDAWTLEGRIVDIADRIAYINHDIDDSIRANIISEADLPASSIKVLGSDHGDRINTMVNDVIESSRSRDDIKMSPEVKKASDELRKFMFQEVYLDDEVKAEADKASYIIQELYNYYTSNPDFLRDDYKGYNENLDLRRNACDYIAGMTDRYVMYKFQEVFMPKSWDII